MLGERELEMSVLEECFSFDVRRGLIAVTLRGAYPCFPPDTRRSDFLKLVDAFYDIDSKEIMWSLNSLLRNQGMMNDERCHFVQRLLPMLTNANVVR
jgi:hypothetical protein